MTACALLLGVTHVEQQAPGSAMGTGISVNIAVGSKGGDAAMTTAADAWQLDKQTLMTDRGKREWLTTGRAWWRCGGGWEMAGRPWKTHNRWVTSGNWRWQRVDGDDETGLTFVQLLSKGQVYLTVRVATKKILYNYDSPGDNENKLLQLIAVTAARAILRGPYTFTTGKFNIKYFNND